MMHNIIAGQSLEKDNILYQQKLVCLCNEIRKYEPMEGWEVNQGKNWKMKLNQNTISQLVEHNCILIKI